MSSKMRTIKDKLYTKYGKRCEVCGEKFKKDKLSGHHIIMKSKGGEITEDNILIACYNCHFGVINKIQYDSEEYWELMKKCLEHRNESTPKQGQRCSINFVSYLLATCQLEVKFYVF